jgi:hypothetical protein
MALNEYKPVFALAVLALLPFVLAGCTSERAPASAPAAATDPLPSWKDTSSKKTVIDYVQRVTGDGSADFVPVPERIAVFDNDGTLWPEAPIPFQAAFVFDELKRRSPRSRSWRPIRWSRRRSPATLPRC